MSYYQRPMGDYKTYGYAGDPGFLSSLWKGIKGVAKTALKVAFPVPTMIYGALKGQKPAPPPSQAFTAGGMPTSFPGIGAMPGTLAAAAGRAPMAFGGVGLGAQAAAPGQPCPAGYHLAKDGSGRMVRNRRMNVANPRALRRSMRRVQGFEKLARRTITFTRRTRLKKRKTS